MLENRNNNRKNSQFKKGFKQEQRSNINMLEQNSDLAHDYYFKLSKFAGNKTVQRMVEDGSIFNRDKGESSLDMKSLTQRKVKEVSKRIPHKKVDPKNYVKKTNINEANKAGSSNRTGLPDQLKSGIENLAKMDLSDIRVHYNSKKPKDINAHAFTQGNEIHVAPGQEKHLAHEAWHVVQQKQGRVKPTTQVGGVNVNDNKALEKEADIMGARALKSGGKAEGKSRPAARSGRKGPVQRKSTNISELPEKVLDKDALTVTPAKTAKGKINRYNRLKMDNPDFDTQLGILGEIIKFLEAVKLKKVAQRVKAAAQRRAVAQLVKQVKESGSKKSKGKSKSKSSSGRKGKAGKKGVKESQKDEAKSDEKKDNSKIIDNFNAIKEQIINEAQVEKKAVEEQMKKFNEEARKLAAEQKENGLAEKEENGNTAVVSKAEEKAKAKDKAEDKPEAEAQKKAKEEKKVEDKEQAKKQAQKEAEAKKQKKEEEKAAANKKEDGEKGTENKEQNKKGDKLKKEKEAQLIAEKKAEDKNKKKAADRAEEQKVTQKEKENKEQEKIKEKGDKKSSPNGKEQQIAKEIQEKRDKKEVEKKDKEKEAGKEKKEAEAQKEKEKKLAQQLKEQPAFDLIKKLTPENILKKYGNNWFTAKKHLTTKEFCKDNNEYSEREKKMKELVDYRRELADKLIKETVDKGKAILAKEVGAGKAEIKVLELGSKALTSDLDFSFSAPGNEEFEVNLVKIFNGSFRKRYGVSSGILFDTNVYTTGFMSKAAGKEEEGAAENKAALGEEHYQGVVRSNEKTQLALGLLPVREFFGKERARDWNGFTQKTESGLKAELRGLKIDNKDKSKVVSVILGTLGGVFKQTENLYKDTSEALNKELENTKGSEKGLSDDHIKAVASDKLYEKQLNVVKSLLKDRKRITKDITKFMELEGAGKLAKSDVGRLKNLRNDLSNNMKRFDVEQGKALVYANEAYYNAGAAIHVVKGMQGGGAVKLGNQGLMESLLMNVGYKLQHFEHHLKEDGHGNALVTTSKYGQRVDNALQQLGTVNNQVEEDRAMLENEMDLLNNFKKSTELKTQSDKESGAKEKHGKSMTGERINEGYLRVAENNIISFYMSKVETLLNKIGNR